MNTKIRNLQHVSCSSEIQPQSRREVVGNEGTTARSVSSFGLRGGSCGIIWRRSDGWNRLWTGPGYAGCVKLRWVSQCTRIRLLWHGCGKGGIIYVDARRKVAARTGPRSAPVSRSVHGATATAGVCPPPPPSHLVTHRVCVCVCVFVFVFHRPYKYRSGSWRK